jgi:nucleotide-binding universal stress UspA family protein
VEEIRNPQEVKTMRILIATDGSSASKSVIKTACQIIKIPESTEVKIISVVEPIAPVGAEPFAIMANYYREAEIELTKQTENLVKQATANLQESCPALQNVSSQVFSGGAAQVIVETAREWKADLIIVGSHGYGFWSRALIGSVSNSVIHHAPCSVLIVRDHEEPTEKGE